MHQPLGQLVSIATARPELLRHRSVRSQEISYCHIGTPVGLCLKIINIISSYLQVSNEHRGRNKRVAWVRNVVVRLGSHVTVELAKGRRIKVMAIKNVGCL